MTRFEKNAMVKASKLILRGSQQPFREINTHREVRHTYKALHQLLHKNVKKREDFFESTETPTHSHKLSSSGHNWNKVEVVAQTKAVTSERRPGVYRKKRRRRSEARSGVRHRQELEEDAHVS